MVSVIMGVRSSKNNISRMEEKENFDATCEVVSDVTDNNMYFTTDALLDDSDNVKLDASHLTLEVITDVERKLDFDEKMSLLYLLHDNARIGLQKMTSLMNQNGEQVISDWVRLQKRTSSSWKTKLIEALAIIQDYHIIKILGFDKQQIYDDYLPLCAFTSLFVYRVRKALFCVFDNLTKSEIKLFLTLVKNDFLKKNLYFESYNEDLLEMYFLHFEAFHYITLSNISNIIKIFKQMEMDNVCSTLEEVMSDIHKSGETSRAKGTTHDSMTTSSYNVKENTDKQQPVSLQLYQDNARQNSLEHVTQPQLSSITCSKIDCYDIDKNNPGICLIINQKYFFRDITPEYQDLLPKSKLFLEKRVGTDEDKKRLIQTFKHCGFGENILIEENLLHTDILEKIKQAALKVENHSSFFVCILSHGDNGIVYGSNSCKVDIQKIEKVMMSVNKKYLANKPKILLLQCCQGLVCQKVELDNEEEEEESDLDVDGPTETKAVPQGVDMCTFLATIPEYSAIRNKKEGSWFIQSFCNKMDTLAKSTHFDEICTATIDEVVQKRWAKDGEQRCMVPIKKTSLRKKLFLPVLE